MLKLRDNKIKYLFPLNEKLKIVQHPSFILPFTWILSIHIYELLVLPSFKIPNEILSYIPLTERFLVIWFANSDASYYLEIARSWYQNTSPVFFPAWPIFIKLTGATYLGTKVLTIILSISFFLLLPKVLKVLNFYDKKNLENMILVILLFPGMLSILVPITEPMILFLIAATIIATEKGNFKASSLLVAIIGATRPNGIVIALYLFLKVLGKGKGTIKRNWIVFPIAISGIALYSLFLHLEYGSVSIYFEEQKKWASSISIASMVRVFTDYKDIVVQIFSDYKPQPIKIYQLISIIFFFFASIISFKKLNRPIWIFSVTIVLIPMISGAHQGVARYLLAGFPLLIPFAYYLVRIKFLFYLYIFISILFQSYLLDRFFNFL